MIKDGKRKAGESQAEFKIAFVNMIEAAASDWKDGVEDYPEFMRRLHQHCLNIYKAGIDDGCSK